MWNAEAVIQARGTVRVEVARPYRIWPTRDVRFDDEVRAVGEGGRDAPAAAGQLEDDARMAGLVQVAADHPPLVARAETLVDTCAGSRGCTRPRVRRSGIPPGRPRSVSVLLGRAPGARGAAHGEHGDAVIDPVARAAAAAAQGVGLRARATRRTPGRREGRNRGNAVGPPCRFRVRLCLLEPSFDSPPATTICPDPAVRARLSSPARHRAPAAASGRRPSRARRWSRPPARTSGLSNTTSRPSSRPAQARKSRERPALDVDRGRGDPIQSQVSP